MYSLLVLHVIYVLGELGYGHLLGQECVMPSLTDLTDEQCIFDFKVRSEARMLYPGACSIEYHIKQCHHI